MMPLCVSGKILVLSTNCGHVTMDVLNYFFGYKRRHCSTNILINLGTELCLLLLRVLLSICALHVSTVGYSCACAGLDMIVVY